MQRIAGRMGVALLALVLFDGSVRAQLEPPRPDPNVVVPGDTAPFPATSLDDSTLVTPNRTETAAADVGSSVTVVTEQQIENTQQSSVLEVLRGKGVDVVQQGGPGRLTSVFIRGANSQQTKVLLDGIPINDPSNATRLFDFSGLTVDNIERIEVLRGPQSMVYGSDAIGGVINIITKRGDGPTTAKISALGGSFGTSRESFQISGGGDRAYFSFGGSYLDSSGISAAAREFGNPEEDRFQNGTLSGRFGWTPSETFSVDYVFRYIDADTAVDDNNFAGFPPFIDNLIRTNTSQAFYNRAQVQSLLLDGALEQSVGFSLTNYRRQDINAPVFLDDRFDGQTRQVDWQANLLLTENNTFTAGVDYLQEDASSTSEAQQMQNNAGVYLQDRWRLFDRVVLTGGVRWDDNSGAGPATTYRATALYRHEETNTALHGSIGTGFRAPSLAEKFFAFGNPALRPERSQGWDLGIEQELFDGGLVFDVTYFDNDFTDLVIFDTVSFALLNIGQARASGVEFFAWLYLTEQTSATVNYTFTDTRDQLTGMRLARRPLHKASLALNHKWPDDQANLNLYLLYVDERLDSPFNGVFLDSYITVNVSGNCWLTDKIELFGRIDNLFDEQYQEVFGFGTPGISAFGGLNFHF